MTGTLSRYMTHCETSPEGREQGDSGWLRYLPRWTRLHLTTSKINGTWPPITGTPQVHSISTAVSTPGKF